MNTCRVCVLYITNNIFLFHLEDSPVSPFGSHLFIHMKRDFCTFLPGPILTSMSVPLYVAPIEESKGSGHMTK